MKIKVLHCIKTLSGGGAERQLTIMLNHHMKDKMELSVFCVFDNNSSVNENVARVYRIQDKKNYPFRLIGEISDVIRELDPDIVHAWLPPQISSSALIAAKLNGKVTVASYRNRKMFESWKRIPEFLTTLLFADSIIANNSIEQSSFLFRKLWHFKNGVTIHNAIDIPAGLIREKVRDEVQLLKVLFVGRLSAQKNWKTLLTALSKIDIKFEWQLTVCGIGEDKEAFNAMVGTLGLGKRIKILGYRKDVYSIMSQSDVLVLPSWYEGMPNVVLESLALGVPSIVSNIEAHTSLFSKNSGVMFFDPRNPEELTTILEKILAGQIDLQQYSRDGLVFSKNFSPEILLDEHYTFYKRLLD